eukprot:Rhum_TRINITY_DN13188_c0_g1::Rhum_TRINITY_DN13188_c0_g1_i1::g.57680::m.57680
MGFPMTPQVSHPGSEKRHGAELRLLEADTLRGRMLPKQQQQQPRITSVSGDSAVPSLAGTIEEVRGRMESVNHRLGRIDVQLHELDLSGDVASGGGGGGGGVGGGRGYSHSAASASPAVDYILRQVATDTSLPLPPPPAHALAAASQPQPAASATAGLSLASSYQPQPQSQPQPQHARSPSQAATAAETEPLVPIGASATRSAFPRGRNQVLSSAVTGLSEHLPSPGAEGERPGMSGVMSEVSDDAECFPLDFPPPIVSSALASPQPIHLRHRSGRGAPIIPQFSEERDAAVPPPAAASTLHQHRGHSSSVHRHHSHPFFGDDDNDAHDVSPPRFSTSPAVAAAAARSVSTTSNHHPVPRLPSRHGSRSRHGLPSAHRDARFSVAASPHVRAEPASFPRSLQAHEAAFATDERPPAAAAVPAAYRPVSRLPSHDPPSQRSHRVPSEPQHSQSAWVSGAFGASPQQPQTQASCHAASVRVPLGDMTVTENTALGSGGGSGAVAQDASTALQIQQLRQHMLISKQHAISDQQWSHQRRLESVIKKQHEQIKVLERRQRETDEVLSALQRQTHTKMLA